MKRAKGKPSTTKGTWKAWVVVLGIAIVAAIVSFFLETAPQPPSVAKELPANEAIGFVVVESPDYWLQELDRHAGGLSPEEKRALAPLLSADSRKAALGFDPAGAANWQDIGVDPERGVALTIDALHLNGALPVPFVWMAQGPPKTPEMAKLNWLSDADWAVAALPVASQATPTAWTAPNGPTLDQDSVLRAAFADMPGDKRTAFYLHADGVKAALRSHLDGKNLAALEHLTQRIRGLSLVLTPWVTAGRVVLSSDAVESLRQIFGDKAPKQPFSQFLPDHGVVALRVSLNLQELFDGLMTWLPPSWMEARLGLASGRLGLLALVGVDWTQLERALSGQAVFALDLSAPATPETPVPWLALLALRDPTVADATLQQLVQQSGQHGRPLLPVQVAGHPGWQSQQPPMVIVRVADTLVIAPARVLAERALQRPQPLAKTADVDGDVVLGLIYQPVQPQTTAADGWRKVLGSLEPVKLALHRDTHGLRLDASVLPIAALLHAAAWYALPK